MEEMLLRRLRGGKGYSSSIVIFWTNADEEEATEDGKGHISSIVIFLRPMQRKRLLQRLGRTTPVVLLLLGPVWRSGYYGSWQGPLQ